MKNLNKLVALALIVTTIGCVNEKHFVQFKTKCDVRNDTTALHWILKWNPPTIKTVEVIKFRPGIPSITTITDTFTNEVIKVQKDTVRIFDTKYITKWQIKNTVDTITKTDSIYSQDNRQLGIANMTISNLQKKYDNLNGRASIYLWWALIATLIVAGSFLIKFLKPKI